MMRTILFLLFLAVARGEHPLEFIDTSIENASPLWYEIDSNAVVRVHLLYDHERNSINRAAGHIHFRLQAKPGSKLTLEFVNLENYWNGVPGSVAGELKTMMISTDGRAWQSVPTELLPTNRVQLRVQATRGSLYVARVEPYRISDLENFLGSIRDKPNVEIQAIGKTVQNRDLEIIRVGEPAARYRVFLRARAHPWESVGNWIVEGFIQRMLQTNSTFCAYIMPMANKDGVALGRTRFNLFGKDLNRNWDKPADPALAPENHALEKWLETMIAAGRKPHFALELHNDGGGRLHISRPPIADLEERLQRMKTFEELLRQHTWFTEGSTTAAFRNSGTLGDGWLQRWGIDAAVHEFNCNWIAGVNDYPNAARWKSYGSNLVAALDGYFAAVKP